MTDTTPLTEEIRSVLNRYSAEAPSGTPDYILAEYLIECLKAFNEAVSRRAEWRGEPVEFTPTIQPGHDGPHIAEDCNNEPVHTCEATR